MPRLLPLAVLAVAAPLALVGTQAFAQDVAFYDGNADGQPDTLIPESAWPSWATRGTGSPTVVFDRGAEEWVMLFEARLSDEFLDGTGMDWDECRPREDGPRVVWGIGRATSPDGLTGWTVDAEPVVTPVPGTWRPCSTAHPWIVAYEDTWHLYYKAEQGFDPCNPGGDESPWGCSRMTGVGYATSSDGGRTWNEQDGADPMLSIGDFGFPTVVVRQEEGAAVDDEQWTMLLTRADGLYLAQSPAPDQGWEFSEANPVLTPGTWTFAQDEWFQPSLTCSAQGEAFRYIAWIGGNSVAGGSGFDNLCAEFPDEWVGDGSPVIAWDADPVWRHWDAVRIGDETYVYYTVRDEENKVFVQLMKTGASTTFDLDPAIWNGRACLYGERPEDPTDGTDDTDTGDTGGTDDTDSDPGGCYCSSSASPLTAAPLLGLLALVGLSRRRRHGSR